MLNEQTTIVQTLFALQPMRQHDIEIIVVDGASDDRSLQLATPLCDLAIVAARGRASQMNAGARVATGTTLLFLHSDTMLPDAAAELIDAELIRTARSWGRFDVQIDSPTPILRLIAFSMNLRSRLTSIATGDQAIFVQRSAFEQVGGFPNIALMEDIALSKSLKRLSPPICIRAKVKTSARRWIKNGVLRTILLMWRLRLAYFLGGDPTWLSKTYADARQND